MTVLKAQAYIQHLCQDEGRSKPSIRDECQHGAQ